MNEVTKTGVALGAAAALTVLALSMKPGEVRLDLFDDKGELFFPEFTDGEAIAELEVTAFREKTSDIGAFVVKRDAKTGLWTIPSHSNYPADAKDQMGKAAAMLIGLRKDAVVGDAVGRHAEYGLIDPMKEGTDTEGRGKRIKLKDSAGNVLADLIVGNEVEDKAGTFYVRTPDKKRIYKTKLDGKMSTQFTDWIDTDLLQAKSWNIQKVLFDNYAIKEQAGQLRIVPGEKITIEKGADNKWALADLDAEKEETNIEKATEVANTFGEIKIVGVRPKPPGLTARLERANGVEAMMLQRALSSKGYFLANGGRMVSNEGDLVFETKSGVRYTLRFGGLAVGEGEELTAGIGSDEPKEDPADGEKAEAEDSANNRFLMVSAEFVEDLLQKPKAARLAQEELDKRKQARTTIEAIQKAVESYRAANEGKLPASIADLTVEPAEGEPLLKAEDVAADPWGNEFQYQPAEDTYVVSSNGADGAVGGTGAGQDVRSDQLPLEDELVKAATEWTSYDKKVETGQEEAEKLTERFGPWYYVIDKGLFDKLKPSRADLVKPKAAEAEEPGK